MLHSLKFGRHSFSFLQLNEAKTRDKLGAAFKHYNAAHNYFSNAIRGNEVTFCVLCVDLSSLYAAVAGEECTIKALQRCLDTVNAFSKEAIDLVMSNLNTRTDWFKKMETLATSIEDRVFKNLRALVKLEDDSSGPHQYPAGTFKELYRSGLKAKMTATALTSSSGEEAIDKASSKLLKLHSIFKQLRDQLNDIVAKSTA